MPRLPRFDVAGIPQHVLQRGRGGDACFYVPNDYRCYLTLLLRASRRWDCAVHAYVLMDNHVHLLVTPSRVGALAGMMQAIGRNYVNYLNLTYQRTGALWEGRFKSCLVEAEHYLLMCYRYIELNPLRNGYVDELSYYPWSSYRCNALGEPDPLIVPHAAYLALGNSDNARQESYKHLLKKRIDRDSLEEIRTYVQQQRVLGSHAFQAHIEARFGRYARARPAHRPRRASDMLVHDR